MIVSELGSGSPTKAAPTCGLASPSGVWPSTRPRSTGCRTPSWSAAPSAAVVVAALNSLIVPDHPLGTGSSIIVGLGSCRCLHGALRDRAEVGQVGGRRRHDRASAHAGDLPDAGGGLPGSARQAARHRDVGGLKPTVVGFLGVIGLLQFLFVGFELSNGAAEEMNNPQRDVPKMILRSGLIASLVTGSIIFGVLLVIPGSALSNVAGFTDAYAAVAGVLGGATHAFNYIFAALIILTAISTAAVWQQGTCRVQAVAALDGAAPLWMGKFSKAGTPVAMNIVSTIIGGAFVAVIFLLTKGSLEQFFAITIAVVISLTAMMYLLIFPAIIPLRKKYPDRRRPFRVPGGTLGMWLCVIGAEAIIVITTITLLWPGLLDRMLGHSYDIAGTWGVSRAYFETVTLSIVAFFVLVAVAFWLWGRRNIARGLVGENDLLAVAPPEHGASRPGEEADLTAAGRAIETA